MLNSLLFFLTIEIALRNVDTNAARLNVDHPPDNLVLVGDGIGALYGLSGYIFRRGLPAAPLYS